MVDQYQEIKKEGSVKEKELKKILGALFFTIDRYAGYIEDIWFRDLIHFFIKDDLNHFLKKYKQNWTDKNRNHCINILYCGQQEFQIDYKIILGLIATESEFRITVQRKNIRKGRVKSVDFGLTQQNSRYYKDRYRATIPYLKQYRIKYTDSKFDMAKNIFSCYMILSDTNKYGNLIHFKDFIASYNVGVHGTKHDYMQKTIDEYYNRFMKNYMEI